MFLLSLALHSSFYLTVCLYNLSNLWKWKIIFFRKNCNFRWWPILLLKGSSSPSLSQTHELTHLMSLTLSLSLSHTHTLARTYAPYVPFSLSLSLSLSIYLSISISLSYKLCRYVSFPVSLYHTVCLCMFISNVKSTMCNLRICNKLNWIELNLCFYVAGFSNFFTHIQFLLLSNTESTSVSEVICSVIPT